MSEPACPCGRVDAAGRPLLFARCCGPILEGARAGDAEALMRSRYSAFVRGDEPYLLASWYPSTRPHQVQIDPATRWLGLEVKSHRIIDGDHAEVEFVARFRTGGGRAQRLHETSRFVREDGRWYYLDGDIR